MIVPLGKPAQAFPQRGGGAETEVPLQGRGVSIGNGDVTRLHGNRLLVGLEVIVPGQYAGPDQLFLQDGYKVQQALGITVTYIIYGIGRNGQSVLARLPLGGGCHDAVHRS